MRTRAKARARARKVDCLEIETNLEMKKSLDAAAGEQKKEELRILGV